MARIVSRKTALVAAAATAIVGLTPGTASARTIWSEYAGPASAPTVDGNCSFIYGPDRRLAAVGCFKASGDKFYIKDAAADGHHVEIRGQINTNGDGFRCYEYRGASAGWLVCDSFWDNIPENAVVAWWLGVWEGDDLLYSSALKLSAA
jgi:hypothetical protein